MTNKNKKSKPNRKPDRWNASRSSNPEFVSYMNIIDKQDVLLGKQQEYSFQYVSFIRRRQVEIACQFHEAGHFRLPDEYFITLTFSFLDKLFKKQADGNSKVFDAFILWIVDSMPDLAEWKSMEFVLITPKDW